MQNTEPTFIANAMPLRLCTVPTARTAVPLGNQILKTLKTVYPTLKLFKSDTKGESPAPVGEGGSERDPDLGRRIQSKPSRCVPPRGSSVRNMSMW